MDDHVDVKVEEQANDLVDEVKVEEDEGEFFFDYYNSYSPTNLEMRDPLDDLEDDDDDLSAFCITPDRLLKKERRGRKITRKRKTQDSSDTATSSKRLKIHNIRKPSLPHQLHLCPCCPSTFETIKAKNTHVSTTHPETSPYPCPICGRRHHFPTALAVHMVTRHETGEKKVSCDKCAKKFVLDQNFQRHIKLHEIEDVKPAVCDVCDSRFKDDARLAKHVEAAHAPRSVHVCDICGKQFDLVTGLKEHVKRLHGPKKVVCDTCGEKFVRRQALTSHRIKEHGADPFMCDQCGITFLRRSALVEHIKSHNGDKRHKCDICDVLFLTNRAMLYHRATHLNERPFPCPHCQHAFKLKVGLTRHIKRIHTPGYVAKIRCRCPHCDKGFNANYFLQVHIRQVHTGERPFACDKEGCGKAYAENKALKLHLRKAHGIEIEPKIKSRLPKSKKMEVSEGGGDKD